MNLKILLPFQIFADKIGVQRIVAETRQGSFGLLPQRQDCVTALSPGILVYETETEGEVYIAVDEGVLVKAGPDVLVSVRRAMATRRKEKPAVLIADLYFQPDFRDRVSNLESLLASSRARIRRCWCSTKWRTNTLWTVYGNAFVSTQLLACPQRRRDSKPF